MITEEAVDAEIERLRAELEHFKPQPMSQNCRDGRHAGTGANRCYNCRCLCHTTDTHPGALGEPPLDIKGEQR